LHVSSVQSTPSLHIDESVQLIVELHPTPTTQRAGAVHMESIGL